MITLKPDIMQSDSINCFVATKVYNITNELLLREKGEQVIDSYHRMILVKSA